MFLTRSHFLPIHYYLHNTECYIQDHYPVIYTLVTHSIIIHHYAISTSSTTSASPSQPHQPLQHCHLSITDHLSTITASPAKAATQTNTPHQPSQITIPLEQTSSYHQNLSFNKLRDGILN